MYNRIWLYAIQDKKADEVLAKFIEEKDKPGAFFRYLAFALSKDLGLAKAILTAGKECVLSPYEIGQLLVALLKTHNVDGFQFFIKAMQKRKIELRPTLDRILGKMVFTAHPRAKRLAQMAIFLGKTLLIRFFLMMNPGRLILKFIYHPLLSCLFLII